MMYLAARLLQLFTTLHCAYFELVVDVCIFCVVIKTGVFLTVA